jgi:hypothetical protein
MQSTTTPNQSHQQGANKRIDKIEQHGTGNGAVGGSITTGPCSNVQVGGSGNQGSVNCTDVAPQITVTKLSEKVPDNGLFKTQFRLAIVTSRAFLLHVKAVAPHLVGTLRIDNERPPEQGGMAFSSVNTSGPGYTEEDYKDIESGNYIVTVQTALPDEVSLECH